MTETAAQGGSDSHDSGSPGRQRGWSFLAVSAAIVAGLALLFALALLLNRLLAHPPG